MEVPTTGFDIFLEHMLGQINKTQPNAGTDPEVWDTLATVGSLTGKSLSLQKGVEMEDTESVQAFSYSGAKITEWEFSVDNGGILMCNFTIDAKEELTDEDLAEARIPNYGYFHFAQGAIEVANEPVATVGQFTFRGANSLKTDRYYLGQSGTKLEQRENDYRAFSGTLETEFEDLETFYDRYTEDSSATLILEFEGAVLPGATQMKETLRITCADVRFVGDTPTIEGLDVGVQNVNFEAFETNPGAAVSILYRAIDPEVESG